MTTAHNGSTTPAPAAVTNEGVKNAVLERRDALLGRLDNLDPVLTAVAGEQFFNTSKLDFPKLLDDPSNIADNLRRYSASFSATARDIIEKFDFDTQIAKLDGANLLYQVVARFCEIDLHPDAVSNTEMGLPIRGAGPEVLRTVQRDRR